MRCLKLLDVACGLTNVVPISGGDICQDKAYPLLSRVLLLQTDVEAEIFRDRSWREIPELSENTIARSHSEGIAGKRGTLTLRLASVSPSLCRSWGIARERAAGSRSST